MKQKIKLNKFSKIFSPFLFIIIWYGAAFLIKAPLILPYPHSVLIKLFSLIQTQSFWLSFAATFLRVISAFLISFILGFFLGLFSADSSNFKNLISFPLAVIRATPLIAFILLALFWFRSGIVPVFVAVLMALPIVISSAEKGFEKNPENKETLFKASCYSFTGWKAFCYIRLPSAKKALDAGAESAFGICWKVVAAGEVLSLPRNATGTLMQRSQVHLETAEVLAVTTILIITSLLTQKIFRKFIKFH